MNIERNCQTCKYYKDGYGYCENLELRPCHPQIGCDDFRKRDELILDEAIQEYKNDAEFERTHGNLQRYLEFSQLVEWLCKYQKIEQIIKDHDADRIPEDYWYIDKIREVLDNGNDD